MRAPGWWRSVHRTGRPAPTPATTVDTACKDESGTRSFCNRWQVTWYFSPWWDIICGYLVSRSHNFKSTWTANLIYVFVCPHLKVAAACRAQLIRATMSPRRVCRSLPHILLTVDLHTTHLSPVANGRYSKQAASVSCVPTVLLDSTAGNRSAQVSRVSCCAILLAHMMVFAVCEQLYGRHERLTAVEHAALL